MGGRGAAVLVRTTDLLRLGKVFGGAGARNLVIRVSLDLGVEVGDALCPVEDRLAHTSVRVRVDRDFQLVVAHVAHRVQGLVACHGGLRYGRVQEVRATVAVRNLR